MLFLFISFSILSFFDTVPFAEIRVCFSKTQLNFDVKERITASFIRGRSSKFYMHEINQYCNNGSQGGLQSTYVIFCIFPEWKSYSMPLIAYVAVLCLFRQLELRQRDAMYYVNSLFITFRLFSQTEMSC